MRSIFLLLLLTACSPQLVYHKNDVVVSPEQDNDLRAAAYECKRDALYISNEMYQGLSGLGPDLQRLGEYRRVFDECMAIRGYEVERR